MIRVSTTPHRLFLLLENPADTVLDHAGQYLATKTTDAPSTGELIGPLRLRVSVAADCERLMTLRILPSRQTDSRVGEPDGVGHVEHQSEDDDRDESVDPGAGC